MQGDHHWRHTCQVSTAMDLHTSAPWKHELRGTSLEAPTRRDITGAAREAVVHKHTSGCHLLGRTDSHKTAALQVPPPSPSSLPCRLRWCAGLPLVWSPVV